MNMKIADTSAQDLMLGQANRKNRRIVIADGVLLLIGVAVSAFIYVADVSLAGSFRPVLDKDCSSPTIRIHSAR